MNRLTITIAVIVLGGITILSLSGALQPSYGTDAGNLPEARTLIAATDESGSMSADYTTGPQTAAAPATAPESAGKDPEPADASPAATSRVQSSAAGTTQAPRPSTSTSSTQPPVSYTHLRAH